ncbi:MAG: PP2C family protein-serine/threonine phosphatase [Alphaproteobacteria bacterium]
MNHIRNPETLAAETHVSGGESSELDCAIKASKILIVDDQMVVRKLIEFYLTAGGYSNLIFAEDGDDALDAIETEAPDLVILDLQMPRMGGFEVCEKLRAHPDYELLPILVQTAADSAEDRARVFAAGATDMIGKPINDAELRARVGIHLQNRHMLNQLSVYRESMERELDIAREMQHGIMPGQKHLDKLKEMYGIDIRSHFETCDALGGDMWNVWPIDTRRMGFTIVDFTGHGVVASLNTFRFQSLVMSNGYLESGNQTDYIERISRRLHSMLAIGQFATAIGGYIDFGEDVIRYVGAAGPKPFLVEPGGKTGRFLASEGRPLGMTRETTYEEREVPFPPGSSLFLYSDALTETPDMVNPVYDDDRIAMALTGGLQTGSHPFDALLADFVDRASGPLDDDLTLVMLSRPDDATGGGR